MNKIPCIRFGVTNYIDQSTAERIPTHEVMMQEINHMRSVCIAYQEKIKLYKKTLDLQSEAINMSKEYIESLEQENRFYNIALGIFCILAGLKLLAII